MMSMEQRGLTPFWRSFSDLGRAGDFIDRHNWPGFMRRASMPTIDMYETEKDVVVEADLPGYNPEDISLRITSYGLTMKGILEKSREDKGDDYYLREREFGSFSRNVRFPTQVISEKATAKYKDGVLRISVPKAYQNPGDCRELRIQRISN